MSNEKSLKFEEWKDKNVPSSKGSNERVAGVVKNVLQNEYGYIDDGTGKDVYFRLEWCKDLNIQIGIKLEFETEMTQKGKRAKKISVPGAYKSVGTSSEDENTPRYFLPADTRNALSLNSKLEKGKIHNLALHLEKFALYEKQETGSGYKFTLFKMNRDGSVAVNVSEYCKENLELYKKNFSRLNSRSSIFTGANCRSFEFNVDWRMVIGLGNESIYETSMTFHPVYGIPYIPGQALKGIARSWYIKNRIAEIDDLNNESEEAGELLESKAEENETFCHLFGCTKESILKKDYQGCILFLDALPVDLNENSLRVDVMNPHYGPYYSKGKSEKKTEGEPPADYYNPNPIFFLTVESTKFSFALGLSGRCEKMNDDSGKEIDLLKIAEDTLKSALIEQAVGAKTAVGYGYFNDSVEPKKEQ